MPSPTSAHLLIQLTNTLKNLVATVSTRVVKEMSCVARKSHSGHGARVLTW